LDVNSLVAVDEDVANGRVVHQRFEWPQAEGFVEDLVDHTLALIAIEQAGRPLTQLVRATADLFAQGLAAEAADGAEGHAASELVVKLALEAAQLLGGAAGAGDIDHLGPRPRWRETAVGSMTGP